jgi:hypothetical protein
MRGEDRTTGALLSYVAVEAGMARSIRYGRHGN